MAIYTLFCAVFFFFLFQAGMTALNQRIISFPEITPLKILVLALRFLNQFGRVIFVCFWCYFVFTSRKSHFPPRFMESNDKNIGLCMPLETTVFRIKSADPILVCGAQICILQSSSSIFKQSKDLGTFALKEETKKITQTLAGIFIC